LKVPTINRRKECGIILGDWELRGELSAYLR